MSTFILTWVVIGALVTLGYILFIVDIDSRWADSFVGYPLIYLFTIFLWPVTVVYVLWSQFSALRSARRG